MYNDISFEFIIYRKVQGLPPCSNDRLLYEAPAIVGLSPFYNIEFKAPNAGASLSFGISYI